MLKLTQTVKKGGCAAKVPAMILREILAGLSFPPSLPEVTVDGTHFDDAAIYQVTPDLSLVQTLDFFTPIVDDPYDFGAVAAANALSDVYAMGGRPKTCMAILAAPLATLDPKDIQAVLQGACDVMAQAGAALVGGHSIDDDTLKFGLSVTGTVHPLEVWSNQTARPGDKLILTKALGTGTICAGIKRQELAESDFLEAITSMKRLNNIVDYLSLDELKAIHAATDVTGFGLAGHGYQLAKASQVTLKLKARDLPVMKSARACLEKGFLTKAHRSNEEYTKDRISFHPEIEEYLHLLTFDPQTSGGLLLSVQSDRAETILKKLSAAFPDVKIIGDVVSQEDKHVLVE